MKFTLKHPKIVIAFCAILTILLAIPLKNIRIESSIRQFFPQHHESYQRLKDTEEKFGSMIAIGISLETPEETILTPAYIDIIRNITNALESVENTSDVKSIVNIDYIEGDNGAINVAPLLDKDSDIPTTEEDIAVITDRLTDWEEMYDLVVINKDRTATQVSLNVNQNASLDEQQEALTEVRKIVNESISGTDLSVKFYGDPVISEDSKRFLLSDLLHLIPLVILVVAVSLFFSFSTIHGTVLVLLSVLMSTVWSVGIMALSGIEFSLVSSVIPVALIGCGSAYGIHVLTHYYVEMYQKREELEKTGEKMTAEVNKECISAGLKNVMLAVILSAATTIAGFISLVTSPIRPLFGFAIFTALGIFFSLVLSVTFVPASLSLRKPEKIGIRSKKVDILSAKVRKRFSKFNRKQSGGDSSSTMYAIYHFFCGSKPRITLFAIGIIVISAVGLGKLIIDTSMVNYFPKTARLRQDIDYVNDNFAGTNSVFLLIKSPAAAPKEEAARLFEQAQALADSFGGADVDSETQKRIDALIEQANAKIAESASLPNMTNPEILKDVDNMEKWIENKFDIVGKAVSYSDSIKRINQTWNAPGARASAEENADAGSTGSDFAADWNSFGDDFGGFSDFADDWGFGDDSQDTAAESALLSENTDFVDPNIEYEEKLSTMMSGKEMQQLVSDTYAKAGGKNASLNDFVRTLQKEMNYNGAAFYEIPYDAAKYQRAERQELSGLISNYTMMLGDSMEQFTDDQTNYTPTVIRMQVQIKTHSTQVVGKMLRQFENYARTHFEDGYSMEATGTGEMEYTMTNLVVSSQLTSLLFSLILVFVIISLSFKSPVAGIIGCIPLAFTIILNYMVMGFTGIKLDLITSIIASVAIGVGIDYTIHFMTEYKSLRMETDDLTFCTTETFRTSGSGIMTNAIAVGLGFLVLCLSKFVVLRYIGVLVALVMFTSSGLALTVIPGLFNLFDPKFLHPGKPKSSALEN